MSRRVLMLVCCVLFAPAVGAAEPAPGPAPAPAVNTDVAAQLKLVQEQLRTLSGNLTQVVERVSEHETQIGQLRKELTELTTQIQDEIVKQQQILDAISQKDSTGNHVPRLSAAMKSTDFRQEMRQAVNDSLSTVGTLKIANRTNDFHRVFVNRVEYGVPAGQQLSLEVPVGTVSTQLPGRELKNWTIAGPRYEQSIDIVPEQPVVTYVERPVTPQSTYYYPPLPAQSNVVYYWP